MKMGKNTHADLRGTIKYEPDGSRAGLRTAIQDLGSRSMRNELMEDYGPLFYENL